MRDLKYDEIYMNLMSKTWIKDISGLFDYCSKDSLSFNSSIYDSMNIIRKGQEIKQDALEEKEIDNIEHLFYIKKENEKYIIENNVEINMEQNEKNINKINNNFWFVIHNKNKKYFLLKNDIIKLGRIKFIVKDMNIVGKEILKSNETFIPFEINKLSRIIEEENCRICYSNDNSNENNPMISICKCKGSMNLHLECLKLWLKSKLEIKEINNKPGVSYIINKFNCELCHEPYPITIKNNNINYNLIDYNVPEGQNYIILQSLNSIKENNYPLSIHVLMFIENESSYILGRGHESDIRITDISVSRSHARIFMKDDKFFMEDLGSKFGSLVLAKEHVILEFGFIYQIGRSLFYFDKDNDNNNNNIDNNYFEKIKKSFLNFTEEL